MCLNYTIYFKFTGFFELNYIFRSYDSTSNKNNLYVQNHFTPIGWKFNNRLVVYLNQSFLHSMHMYMEIKRMYFVY